MFAGLQADGGEIADFGVLEHFLEFGEGSRRAYRQRFRHLIYIMDGEESAVAIGQIADVFSRTPFG